MWTVATSTAHPGTTTHLPPILKPVCKPCGLPSVSNRGKQHTNGARDIRLEIKFQASILLSTNYILAAL